MAEIVNYCYPCGALWFAGWEKIASSRKCAPQFMFHLFIGLASN